MIFWLFIVSFLKNLYTDAKFITLLFNEIDIDLIMRIPPLGYTFVIERKPVTH